MLINFSNHPFGQWTAEQQSEAVRLFGSISDLAFPTVDPNGDENYIEQLALSSFNEIIDLSNNEKISVHIMGEMNLTHSIVNMLKNNNIPCYASTTSRKVTDMPDGTKTSVFQFCRFRQYA